MIHRKVRVVGKKYTIIFLELNEYGIKAVKMKRRGTVKVEKISLEKVTHLIDSLEKNKENYRGGKIHFDKTFGKEDEKFIELLEKGKVEIMP